MQNINLLSPATKFINFNKKQVLIAQKITNKIN